MPDLPLKKIGIIACSGEELPEGTVTRLAALKVLQDLCPDSTVTICLPLFLAGGESDRAFARFYPTIAIDGCEKRCAYRGTERYSNRPAAGFVVSELVIQQALDQPQGRRRLDTAGMHAVEVTARQVADKVDEILGKAWSRREGKFTEGNEKLDGTATCSCGSGIPVQKVIIKGREKELVALPLLFEKFCQGGKAPGIESSNEIMEMVKIYNQVDPSEEADIAKIVLEEYTRYWRSHMEKP